MIEWVMSALSKMPSVGTCTNCFAILRYYFGDNFPWWCVFAQYIENYVELQSGTFTYMNSLGAICQVDNSKAGSCTGSQ